MLQYVLLVICLIYKIQFLHQAYLHNNSHTFMNIRYMVFHKKNQFRQRSFHGFQEIKIPEVLHVFLHDKF
jgi:hypothetical protein